MLDFIELKHLKNLKCADGISWLEHHLARLWQYRRRLVVLIIDLMV
jgi:hypothetical protein